VRLTRRARHLKAIFDADFHPDADFLLKTIPYLNVREFSALHLTKCNENLTLACCRAQDNPDVGFVQARWIYANGSESLLTRVQEIGALLHGSHRSGCPYASPTFGGCYVACVAYVVRPQL
jgi:hypothetical protein